MLIENGNIQIVTTSTTGGQSSGINETTGFPVIGSGSNVTTPILGEKIRCQFKTVSKNNNAVVQNNVTTLAEYTALINLQSFPLNGATVKLTDLEDVEIGIFSVIRADKLKHVDHVKLYLK